MSSFLTVAVRTVGQLVKALPRSGFLYMVSVGAKNHGVSTSRWKVFGKVSGFRFSDSSVRTVGEFVNPRLRLALL